MTGFIRGLFGRNKDTQSNSGAFFLNEDDAKSFGDIEFMRSNKVVKRTFAKKKGQEEEIESIRQISAMKKQDIDERGFAAKETPKTESQSTFQPSSFGNPSFGNSSFSNSSSSSSERRQPSNDMDMFRDMAKDIRKKR